MDRDCLPGERFGKAGMSGAGAEEARGEHANWQRARRPREAPAQGLSGRWGGDGNGEIAAGIGGLNRRLRTAGQDPLF